MVGSAKCGSIRAGRDLRVRLGADAGGCGPPGSFDAPVRGGSSEAGGMGRALACDFQRLRLEAVRAGSPPAAVAWAGRGADGLRKDDSMLICDASICCGCYDLYVTCLRDDTKRCCRSAPDRSQRRCGSVAAERLAQRHTPAPLPALDCGGNLPTGVLNTASVRHDRSFPADPCLMMLEGLNRASPAPVPACSPLVRPLGAGHCDSELQVPVLARFARPCQCDGD